MRLDRLGLRNVFGWTAAVSRSGRGAGVRGRGACLENEGAVELAGGHHARGPVAGHEPVLHEPHHRVAPGRQPSARGRPTDRGQLVPPPGGRDGSARELHRGRRAGEAAAAAAHRAEPEAVRVTAVHDRGGPARQRGEDGAALRVEAVPVVRVPREAGQGLGAGGRQRAGAEGGGDGAERAGGVAGERVGVAGGVEEVRRRHRLEDRLRPPHLPPPPPPPRRRRFPPRRSHRGHARRRRQGTVDSAVQALPPAVRLLRGAPAAQSPPCGPGDQPRVPPARAP